MNEMNIEDGVSDKCQRWLVQDEHEVLLLTKAYCTSLSALVNWSWAHFKIVSKRKSMPSDCPAKAKYWI